MSEPSDDHVLARAKQTLAQKGRNDRSWDKRAAKHQEEEGHTTLRLSDRERSEYLDQARHELRSKVDPGEK
ncbi:hypothetical protein [uncultured Enterovirga sp.]|uniref:hypothetical protein n=1 Tax=uncultured Enterovirga sp. TaxID=2026352 RepID=UPI0035C99E07